MGILRDFSQSCEQEKILDWAKEQQPGRFLDLGAGDGETFSNTHALYAIGWPGVCVEAAPWAFDKISKLYHGTNVYCANVTVTADQSGLRDFHYARDDHLSSLESGHAARWEVATETMTVMVCPLADLLDFFDGPFQMASIDTEGSSVDLLRAYRKNAFWEELRCVCVEAESLSDRKEITRICKGWRTLAVTTNNMVMAR